MNAIRILRPYMASFPLTPESCWLHVGFDDNKGVTVRPPYIASAILNQEVLDFTKYQDFVGNRTSPLKTVCKRSAAKSLA